VSIDWATLVAIAVVAAAAALAVVLLVAFALVALSGPPGTQVDSADGGALGTHTVAGTAVAALCLLAAGLIVCFGLYLIIA
jgi:hypothetical protein